MSDRQTDRIYVVATGDETLKVTTDPTEATEWASKWNVHTKVRDDFRGYVHEWNSAGTEEHLNEILED